MAVEDARGVLVTGGAGFIGAAVVHRLVRAGRPVVVLDDLSTGHADRVRGARLVVGDVGDEALVRRLLESDGLGSVIHLAARLDVAESLEKPALYEETNHEKTRALARACRTAGVSQLVFSSTAAVYGEPEHLPIPEDHPLRPVSPYGESKRAAEGALVEAGLRSMRLRFFNAAGGEAEHGIGERGPPRHLIPRAIAAARTGEPLAVYGTDHPTHDGTCIRDYVHVGDLADAHLAALDRLEAGEPGGVFNLGAGRGVSVRQVLAAVARVLGRPIPTRDAPPRVGDPVALVADVRRAASGLGWRPRRSDLLRLAADAATASPPDPGRRGMPFREGPLARTMPRMIVVAIDGPAGAGKSTVARMLADDLGWAYLDTGAMYRAVTLLAQEQELDLADAGGLAAFAEGLELRLSGGGTVRVGGRDVTAEIRTPAVSRGVSEVASVPEVRRVMVAHQRRFAAENGRIVAEGRDIGTVVFPDARVKIFLDAEPRERARRRLAEDAARGPLEPGTDVARVQRDLEARDERDRSRDVAPLRAADDAWHLDTSDMTLSQVFEAVRSHVRSGIPVTPEPPAAQ